MANSEQARKQKDKFHTQWFQSVEVLSASVNGNNVKVTWRFPVTAEYTNPAKLLHGAAQALFGESPFTEEMGSTLSSW